MRPLSYLLGGVLVAGLYLYTTSLDVSRGKGRQASFLSGGGYANGKKQKKNKSYKRRETPSSNDRYAADRRRVNPYPIPKRIDMGHIEGKGIGYEKGYSKLAVLFGPEYEVGHTLALLDVRGIVFDDGKVGANVGVITRFLPRKFCEVFGLNLFYDYREGKYGNFNQVSGGFEMLHRRFELHANARVPVGATRHTKKCVFTNFVGPYREVCKLRQYAEYAFDMDFGYYMVNGKDFQLYAAVGPYYLCGHKSAVGGKAVFRPQFGDYLSVELSASHDRIYDTIYQVNVTLTIPLYNYSSAIKHKRGPCDVANRQIYSTIDRDIVLYNGRRCCTNNFGCPVPLRP